MRAGYCGPCPNTTRRELLRRRLQMARAKDLQEVAKYKAAKRERLLEIAERGKEVDELLAQVDTLMGQYRDLSKEVVHIDNKIAAHKTWAAMAAEEDK
jgi:hypothetical protein